MYKPRTTYTQEQLAQHAIRDLEVDLACAVRDGLLLYAAEVRAELDAKQAEYKDTYITADVDYAQLEMRTATMDDL